jgi:hypothetical protein
MVRQLKFLPLSFPFTTNRRFWNNCVKEENKISPRIFRNGFFFDRKTGETWIEINGEGWLYGSKEFFMWDLSHSSGNNRMQDRDFCAITVLIQDKVINQKSRLYKLWKIENEMRSLRQISISSGISAMKLAARIQKFRQRIQKFI